jgi:hypothetical protein
MAQSDVENNTSPNIYSGNTSCTRIFEVQDMAIVTVDYPFPYEESLVSKQNRRLEVRNIYNLV